MRGVRENVLSDPALLYGETHPEHPVDLRTDIVSSWRRSRMNGVIPDSDDVPYSADFKRPARLIRAATPVLDRLADQLYDSGVTILLADSEARIIDRRAGERSLMNALDRAHAAPGFSYSEEHVGTNGLGSALEERRPFLVQGPEHYRDYLQEFACVAAPLIHPISRSVQGVLNVTCRFDESNRFMQPLIMSAVREIESRVYADASLRERMLLEEFLRVSRKTTSAVVSLNQDFLISNSAAAKLLEPSDQALLWEWSTRMLAIRDEYRGRIRLAQNVDAQATAKKVSDGAFLAGVLIEIKPQPTLHRPVQRVGPAEVRRPGESDATLTGLTGRSTAWDRLRRDIDAITAQTAPVLLTGEAGTGKLYVAWHIHQRRTPEEVCTVLDAVAAQDDPDAWYARFNSRLKSAGTVVVRHLDRLPDDLVQRVGAAIDPIGPRQARLIVTAHTRRGDRPALRLLDYFPVSANIPPLRYRLEDIADLAPILIGKHSRSDSVPRLETVTLQTLVAHDWPGNVRELEAALSTAVMRSRGADITPAHLPPEYRSAPSTRKWSSLERAERDTILQALSDADGNKLVAAKVLGVARSTLYRKMRTLGIDGSRFGVLTR